MKRCKRGTCGKKFIPKDEEQKFCSQACAKKTRRNRTRKRKGYITFAEEDVWSKRTRPGLETRGERPDPKFRGELSKIIHIELDRALRREISIKMIYGNSWPGYLENGNPHGDPRPGPIPEPIQLQGIKFQ